MRFSYALTLSLISFNPNHLSLVSAGSASGRHRMLQKNEDRLLKNIKAGGNGRGSGNGGGSGNSSRGGNKGKFGRGEFVKGGFKDHSSHLDANDNGITLDAVEYVYGTPVDISFELTNDMVPYETQLGLDLAEMPNWTMGIFMRMANPQDGALDPIASVTPVITDAPDDGTRRALQDAVTTTTTSTTPSMEPEEPVEPPTLNHVGTATFKATDAKTLDAIEFGTGFDIYLLDQNGAAISGPATFYMLQTDAMKAAEAEETSKKSNHPLAKHNHAHKKQPKGQGYGKGGALGSGGKSSSKFGISKPDSKGQGYGSGANGGMIMSSGAEGLATYVLETDLTDYVMGDDVVVTYDLSPEVVERMRRVLQRKGNGGGNKGKGGGNKGSGPGNDGTDQQSTTSTTQPPPSTTTEVTTTEATTTLDISPIENTDQTDMPEVVDNTDMTKFSMGIFMRMAHPQRGQLEPIHKVALCPDENNCEDAGSITFSTNELDLGKYGGGYDVWILNASGGGVVGPFTFYVTEP